MPQPDELTAVHVVPADDPPGRRHEPEPTCWCSPMRTYKDVATGRWVYRHRTPPVPRRERTEPTYW